MFIKRWLARRYNDWRTENVFGIDVNKIKAAFQSYQENKALAGDDAEKRLQAIESLLQQLEIAFGAKAD